MSVNWSRILGNYSVEKTKKQAQAVYSELLAKGVAEEEAIKVCVALYCKPTYVSGEKQKLMDEAIASVPSTITPPPVVADVPPPEPAPTAMAEPPLAYAGDYDDDNETR